VRDTYLVCAGRAVSLSEHISDVETFARGYATRCGLGEWLAEHVARAARKRARERSAYPSGGYFHAIQSVAMREGQKVALAEWLKKSDAARAFQGFGIVVVAVEA